jgi:hypothetical protein
VDDRIFDRIAGLAALAVAAFSLLYAVGYLVIAPAAQRTSDVDAFYRSYLAHPGGLRLASTCLLLSGLIIGLPAVALRRRLLGGSGSAATWAAIAGVVAGFGTAAHGLASLVGTDRLAQHFLNADAATHAAIVVAHVQPSEIDPNGLATFALAGLAVLVFGAGLRPSRRGLGTLGIVLGVDMVALLVANSVGSTPAVLVTGGLASVILGPIWWVSVGRLLLQQPGGLGRPPTAGRAGWRRAGPAASI